MTAKYTLDDFIRKAKEVHGDRYDYNQILEDDYQGMDRHVRIVCRVHGGFAQKPKFHLKGTGCRECGWEISRAAGTAMSKTGVAAVARVAAAKARIDVAAVMNKEQADSIAAKRAAAKLREAERKASVIPPLEGPHGHYTYKQKDQGREAYVWFTEDSEPLRATVQTVDDVGAARFTIRGHKAVWSDRLHRVCLVAKKY